MKCCFHKWQFSDVHCLCTLNKTNLKEDHNKVILIDSSWTCWATVVFLLLSLNITVTSIIVLFYIKFPNQCIWWVSTAILSCELWEVTIYYNNCTSHPISFNRLATKTGQITAHTAFPTLTMTLNVAYKTHNKVDGHETYGSMTWGCALFLLFPSNRITFQQFLTLHFYTSC